MPTLVRTDRDAVGIFLDGRQNDVIDTTVVAEVHDLNALCLDQAPHYVNGCIVTVKQRSCSHKAQRGRCALAGRARQIVGCRTHASTLKEF